MAREVSRPADRMRPPPACPLLLFVLDAVVRVTKSWRKQPTITWKRRSCATRRERLLPNATKKTTRRHVGCCVSLDSLVISRGEFVMHSSIAMAIGCSSFHHMLLLPRPHFVRRTTPPYLTNDRGADNGVKKYVRHTHV